MFQIGRTYGSCKSSRLAFDGLKSVATKSYRAYGSTTAMIGFYLVKKIIENRLAVG